jgi:hypothetical protein
MTTKYTNYPLHEILTEADRLIGEGWMLFQKFSCDKCMARLTMDAPNTFWTEASCDKCGHVTNIMKTGCNYMAVLSSDPEALKKLTVLARDEAQLAELKRGWKQ